MTTSWGGGGGMQAKASKNSDIVLLSIFYLINHFKNIQNIKNCLDTNTP